MGLSSGGGRRKLSSPVGRFLSKQAGSASRDMFNPSALERMQYEFDDQWAPSGSYGRFA
jgi:hypothetical protein